MAATCNVYPQVRKENKMVDSILFTNLLSAGIKRNDAIDIYTKIFTTPFKREHGDWENFPDDYKGGLDVNGQPSIDSILTSPFFSYITSAIKGKGLGEFAFNVDLSDHTIDFDMLNRIGIGKTVWNYLLTNTSGGMYEMVKRLHDATPPDVRNYLSINSYTGTYTLPDGANAFGLYRSDGDQIDLYDISRQSKEKLAHTLLHEMVHATTYHKIENNKNHPNIKELEDFLARIKQHPQIGKHYGFTDIHELVAEAYTNPNFQEQLAKIRGVFEGGSLLVELANIIKKILGINEGNNTTALDFVFDKTFFLFDNNAVLQDGVSKNTGAVLALKGSPFSKAALEDIEKKATAEGLRLDRSDNTYKDDTTTYKRLTEWVGEGFSKLFQDMKMTAYEANAYKIFTKKNLDIKTDKIALKDENGNPREYTYPDLVEHERMLMNTRGRVYGDIVHAMIQNKIKPSADVQKKIAEWMDGIPGESYPQNLKDFQWVEGSIAKVFEASDINIFNRDVDQKDKDKLSPEVLVSSKLLGIATAIDNLIQHSDGNFSIIDWKTGGLFTDKLVSTYMRYGRNQVTSINDTKLNRAKLEIVVRAMMVKESMGDKNTRFRNLKVVHVDKKGYVTTSQIDIVPFLGLIESYFKDSENKKLDEYQQMKDMGLFNAHEYMGSNRDLESDLIDEVPSAAMEKHLKRLTQISNAMKDKGKTIAEKAQLDSERLYHTAQIGKLKSQTYNSEFEADQVEDIGTFKRWFGNTYSPRHPKLKAFGVVLAERKDAARKRIREIFAKHDELIRPILEQYYEAHGMKNMLRKSTKVLLGGINGLKYEELFEFMWEDISEGDKEGKYARIIREENGKYTDGKKDDFTKEQYEYNKWYRETMATNYKKVASKVGLYRGSKPVTVGEMMGKPDELDARFMPRYMLNQEEILERYGFASKENMDYMRDNYLSSFTEQEYNQTQDQFGIPIKYMGNKEIIDSENYTFSAELAFKNFMSTIIMKDELDDVHSFGYGLVKMLENDTEGGQDMTNSIGFLKDQIMLHVLDTKKLSKWSTKGFTFPVTNADGSKGTRTISIDSVMKILRSWISAQAMWVKPAAAGTNAALIFTLQLNKALVGSLAKSLGVPPDQVDFTLTDLAKAHKSWGEMVGDMARGKKEENKMWQFAKMMDYLPDNYDGAIRKNQLMGVKNSLFDKANLYLFHSIGEEYGSYIIMAAQMHRYQMNGKSAWEQHEIQNGKLVYIGGKRGNLDDGTELHGLTSFETTKFKRASARIHGGYRQDERCAMELTAMGQWALQFRKYLPNVLENLIQGKYEDLSIGNYILKQNDKGEDVYSWVARINEGRVRVMGKWILTMMQLRADDDYKWSNLKDEQKLQIYEILVAGSMWSLMTAGRVAVLGDADDDDQSEFAKAWNLKLKRLAEDTTQGLFFWDLLSSLQNQTSVLPKLYKTSSAAYDFLFRGLIQGETTQRGDVVGYNTLTNGLPIFTSIKDWTKYLTPEDDAVRRH